MPRSKSVLKRQRTSERKRQRNQSVRSALRTYRKRAAQALAPESVRELQRKVDKAATKGAVHKNKASRIKSRAARALNKTAS